MRQIITSNRKKKMTLFILRQRKFQEMSSSWTLPCCHLSVRVTESQDPRALPCGQQYQANVGDEKSYRLCDDHKKSFKLQWGPSCLNVQALEKKLPNSCCSLGKIIFLTNLWGYMSLEAHHWEVCLLFLNRHFQPDKRFQNLTLGTFPRYY